MAPHTDEGADRVWKLDYLAAVAMRYHSRRGSFLHRVARIEPVCTILLGSSAFAAATSGLTWAVMALTLTTALLSAILLAYGVADRARLHERQFQQWAQFRADVANADPADAAAIRGLEARQMQISAESPDQLEALTIICMDKENEFRRADERYDVGPWQRAFAQWFTFPWRRFDTVSKPPPSP